MRQFALRSLFGLMTVIAIACGWIGWRARELREQATIVAQLRNAEHSTTTFELEPALPTWLWGRLAGRDAAWVVTAYLHFYDGDIVVGPPEDVVRSLGRLRMLRGLHNLGGANVNDRTIKYIVGLPHLEALGLLNADITDRGIEQVAEMRSLKRLDITNGPTFRTASSVRFTGRAKLTDRCAEILGRMRTLDQLSIVNVGVTDAGLAHLAANESLTALSLQELALSEAGVRSLSTMRRLSFLDLSHNSAIDDACLEHVSSLSALETLGLEGTGVTGCGLLRLSRSIPRLVADHHWQGTVDDDVYQEFYRISLDPSKCVSD